MSIASNLILQLPYEVAIFVLQIRKREADTQKSGFRQLPFVPLRRPEGYRVTNHYDVLGMEEIPGCRTYKKFLGWAGHPNRDINTTSTLAVRCCRWLNQSLCVCVCVCVHTHARTKAGHAILTNQRSNTPYLIHPWPTLCLVPSDLMVKGTGSPLNTDCGSKFSLYSFLPFQLAAVYVEGMWCANTVMNRTGKIIAF